MCDTGVAAPVAEPSTEGDAERGGPEKRPEEEMEKQAAAVEGGQYAGSSVQVEPERGGPLLPDDRGVQEVTSARQLELIQGRETPTSVEREPSPSMHGNRQSQDRGAVSGPCLEEQYLHTHLPTACSSPVRTRERHDEEARGSGPFYYFGGSNGAVIVSGYCESKGWKRIYNNLREDFKLKWCETKSAATYRNFREGEQLIFQNPNNKVLTSKIGLLSSLREYERVSSKVNHGQVLRRLKMEEFIPTTFRLDVREEREAFFALQEGVSKSRSAHGSIWICKPSSLNQGRGIFLLKNKEEVAAFRAKLQDVENSRAYRKPHHRQPQARIIQHYIHNPLLLMGKKFDVRSFLLIACTAPHMVFFRHGYVRLTCDPYDPHSSNLSAHLTNQYMQKKNPLYSQLKEDTVWSMESFNAYVNDRFQVAKGLPRDWVLGVFAKRMQNIMTQCFLAAKAKFDCRLGLFDLIGCDFMVDEDFKVWLLEMNANPALHVNCKVLSEVIPSTVVESLDITLEIFNKCRLRKRILPLTSQREFVLLYTGYSPPAATRSELSRKTCQQNQKPPAAACKSGMEGEAVASGSFDSSLNVPGECAQCPAAASSSVKSPVHRRPMPGPPSVVRCDSRSQAAKTESSRPRLEIKPSKCTLHYDPKAADNLVLMPRTMPVVTLPPSPAVTDETAPTALWDTGRVGTLPPTSEHQRRDGSRTAGKTARAEHRKEER